MAASSMLTQIVFLDSQPGGIIPEVHLKKNSSSLRLHMRFPTEGFTNYNYKPCLIKGKLPNGSELFVIGTTYIENLQIAMTLYETTLQNMTAAVGRYKCTLTILDASTYYITRQNYMNYNFLSVLPFFVVVHDRA